MSEELAGVLNALGKRYQANLIKVGKHSPGGPVFSMRYEDFHEAWKRAQRIVKVRYRSPHSIRHTWASQQLAAGADIAWVSKQLGHSSPAVTLGIYSHFIPGRKPRAVDALDREKAKA